MQKYLYVMERSTPSISIETALHDPRIGGSNILFTRFFNGGYNIEDYDIILNESFKKI